MGSPGHFVLASPSFSASPASRAQSQEREEEEEEERVHLSLCLSKPFVFSVRLEAMARTEEPLPWGKSTTTAAVLE